MKPDKRYGERLPAYFDALCAAPEMTRLRDVGMNCGCEYTSFKLFRRIKPYSRFEHSIGTAQIVWHFTADPVQAAAALFHDIATPAFSHSVDFMRGDSLRQESTEAGTDKLILSSKEICRILRENGIVPENVVDYHRYPVADNQAPRLSADRLEYTLGNLLHYRLRAPGFLRSYYLDLTLTQNEDGVPELAFRDILTAIAFGYDALKCSRIYVSPEDRYAMQMLSELLKRALDRGVIGEDDLMGTEPQLIRKLQGDPRSKAEWKRFRAMKRMVTEECDAPVELRRVIPAKKRCIDPLVEGQGRLSAICREFEADLKLFLEEDQSGWLYAK